jgi:hypothetical protein
MRPNVSAAPPAAKGAMILTGRLGQSCADAVADARQAKAAAVINIARSLCMSGTVGWRISPDFSPSPDSRHGVSPGSDKLPPRDERSWPPRQSASV